MSKARDIADRGSSIDSSEITDGAVTAAKLASGAVEGAMVTPSGRRNLIINGAMQVAQRGTSFTSTGVIYTLDRWKAQARAGASITTTKEADQVVDGKSFGVLQYNVTTAASDGLTLLNQYIESGSQDLYGQEITLSWYARVTSGSATMQPVYEMNAEASDLGDTETLTSTWQRFTYTTTLTGYTYPATTYEHLRFAFYVRDNSAHTVQITGVQLEVGSVATPFEHRSYGEELALCQRYYEKISYPQTGSYVADSSSGAARVNGTYFVQKRAAPTIVAKDSDWAGGGTDTTYAFYQGASNQYGPTNIEFDAEL